MSKSLMPLVLSVKRSTFRRDDPEAEHANAGFKKVRPSVISRDNATCRFCDFQDKKHIEVHHLDDRHDNNDQRNLLCACVLCHASQHIGFAAAKRRGLLIYLPPELGLTQADISNLVRTLWVAKASKDGVLAKEANLMLQRLERASIEMTKRFKSSDPFVLSEYLLKLSDEEYAKRASWLQGVYLFPLEEAFSKEIATWANVLGKTVPVSSWLTIARQKVEIWQQGEDA